MGARRSGSQVCAIWRCVDCNQEACRCVSPMLGAELDPVVGQGHWFQRMCLLVAGGSSAFHSCAFFHATVAETVLDECSF
jgi:hypothetical protein